MKYYDKNYVDYDKTLVLACWWGLVHQHIGESCTG